MAEKEAVFNRINHRVVCNANGTVYLISDSRVVYMNGEIYDETTTARNTRLHHIRTRSRYDVSRHYHGEKRPVR